MMTRSSLSLLLLALAGISGCDCSIASEAGGQPQFVRMVSNQDTILALRNDGSLYCFGWSSFGECGFRTGYGAMVPTRTDVVGCASDVSLGDTAAFAVNDSGEVLVWGTEELLEFGTGIRGRALGPGETAVVPGLDGIAQVRTSGFWVFALNDDGDLFWWGRGGTPYAPFWSATPQHVEGLPPIRVVAVEGDYVCALSVSGRVFCWGTNSTYEGGWEQTTQEHPVEIPLPQRAVNVSTAADLTCVVLEDGSSMCWGNNQWGLLLQDPALLVGSSTPVLMTGLPPVDEFRGNGEVECAFAHGGQLYCWGIDTFTPWPGLGMLLAPRAIDGLPDVLDAAFIEHSLCALRSDHSIWCFDGYGQDWTQSVNLDLAPTDPPVDAPPEPQTP